MERYFGKARELGEMILASEESIHLADCRAAFEADEEAKSMIEAYTKQQNEIQSKISSGVMGDEEYISMTERLRELGSELKAHPVAGTLIRAESDFNAFVNRVFGVLRSTVTGVAEDCGAGGCEGCQGCGH